MQVASMSPPPLRLGWLSMLQERDALQYCTDENKFGAYRYYCDFFRAVNASAKMVFANCVKKNGTIGCRRPRNDTLEADALFLPFHCTRRPSILADCFEDTLPSE